MNNLQAADRISDLTELLKDFENKLNSIDIMIDEAEEGSEKQEALVKKYNEVNSERRKANIEKLELELALEKYEELVERGEIK